MPGSVGGLEGPVEETAGPEKKMAAGPAEMAAEFAGGGVAGPVEEGSS